MKPGFALSQWVLDSWQPSRLRLKLSGLQLVALVGAVMPLVVIPPRSQLPDLVGSWRGTSTCVDKAHYPACNDEHVIYDARQKGSAPDTVTLRADKVANGVREFMGEFDFHRAPDSTWVAEVQSPRGRIRIVLWVRADHLTGFLADEPAGRRVRAIAAERIPT